MKEIIKSPGHTHSKHSINVFLFIFYLHGNSINAMICIFLFLCICSAYYNTEYTAGTPTFFVGWMDGQREGRADQWVCG